MIVHIEEHIDCGEVDATGLTEAWDVACADGTATLDPDHIAWSIAADLAEDYETRADDAEDAEFADVGEEW